MPGPGPITAVAVLVAILGSLIAAPKLVPAGAGAPIVLMVQHGSLVVVLLLTVLLGRWRPGDCGMGRCSGRQLLAGLAMVPLLIGAAFAIHPLVILAFGKPPPAVLRIDQIILQLYDQHGLVVAILLTGVLPGLIEEPLLRGVVLTGLRRRLPATVAVVATALVFAALHLSPWRFFPQFILGLAAGLLTVRTGSCWPAAAMHAAYNALIVILTAGPLRT